MRPASGSMLPDERLSVTTVAASATQVRGVLPTFLHLTC